MEGDKENNHKTPDESSKLTNEYLQKASYLGTILPLLDIAYETLIEKKIKKYDLNIVKEFWIYFGLLVLTSIYYYFGLRFEVVIFFLFATIFTLIVYNFDFFKRRLIPDEPNEIRRFITEIDQKSFSEVIEFTKEYRNKLNDDDIRIIINSNHGNTWAVYKFLLNYQKFSSDILVHIIKANRFGIIDEDLFKKYIKRFKVSMTFENYSFLVNHFKDNKKILKTINTFNPAYLNKGSAFKTVATAIQSFYVSVRLGKISEAIKFISVSLVVVIAIVGFNQVTSPYMTMEPYLTFPILLLMNYLFAIAITATLVIVFLTFCFTALTEILWFVAGFFAPDDFQGS